MSITKKSTKIDFASGPVWKCIIAQAIPLTIAQLVQLLYNVVDRIYLGHMGDGDSMALTGVGLTFPIVSLIMAFTALFGYGGTPLFSIARGAGDDEKAKKIMGNSFALLVISSIVLTIAGYIFAKPILFAFGAGEGSYVYAKKYLDVYLIGTIFSMISTGMNGYVNAQGFPRIGMLSVIIGAVANVILDPIFIFGFSMGVAGAGLATVISQALSAVWVFCFLINKKTPISLTRSAIRIRMDVTKDICKLGTANFIMQGTNCLVQVVCNSTLQTFGGDLYVGIMTVTNSVREIFTLPVTGIVNGSQPVISYNYGAKQFRRVKTGINFNTLIGAGYTAIAWIAVILLPKFWFGIFSDDATMLEPGIEAMKIYFFGFVFMALQFSAQSTFQAVGDARHSVFFSLLRKAIIVTPLTLILPRLGLGVLGVFIAEPVSNVVGGIASYVTMRAVVYKKVKREIALSESKGGQN